MKPYNILYLHTHDSGKVFSPYGYQVDTPNIMKLAQDSILFKNAFCASPTCSPSRSAMLTGMYPHSSGMIGLGNRGFSISNYDWHLVNELKDNGYHTALCGIQHESGHFAKPEEAAQIIGYDSNITTDKNVKEMKDKYIWDYENALNASQWIRNCKGDRPFFLSYGLFATHRSYPSKNDDIVDPKYLKPPYPIPDTPETREDYARHLISLKNADNCVGLVINSLKEAGLYEDTIIIFTTDHGIAVPFSKCNLFDTGIGVAFMFREPNSQLNGTVNDNLLSQIDLYPTICDILNIEKPDRLEGKSFAGYFEKGESNPHRNFIFTELNYHTSYEPARSVRTDRYKYIKYYDKEYLKVNLSNINDSSVKKIYVDNELTELEKEEEALYDLLYDPGERNNLVGDSRYQDTLELLKQELNNWQIATKDPILQGQIKKKDNWKVNKKTSLTPSGSGPDDFE